MKTARSTPSHGTSTTTTQYRCRSPASTTPLTSPRMMVHSVGQAYPPTLSSPHYASPGVSLARHSPSVSHDNNAPSSLGYFGLKIENSAEPRESAAVPRDNWSSPSSSVKSFSAAAPKQSLPHDANPAFEAFRKQAEAGHFNRSFSLGSSQFSSNKMPPGTPQLDMMTSVTSVSPARPPPPRRGTHESGGSLRLTGMSQFSLPSLPLQPPQPSQPQPAQTPAPAPTPLQFLQGSFFPPNSAASLDSSRPASSQMDIDADANSLHDSAYVSSDSKRNSQASIEHPFFSTGARFESPVSTETAAEQRPLAPPFPLNLGRLSVSVPNAAKTTHGFPSPSRAETAPAKVSDVAQGPLAIDGQKLSELLAESEAATAAGKPATLLLLDIRVSTHFSASRIRGALNMCIPTTLLKRATFTTEKMRMTFADPAQTSRFASWSETQHIVVYDNTLEGRDMTSATNMARKFTNEGYKGQACILRGGFKGFAQTFPALVDASSAAPAAPDPASSLTLGAGGRPQRLKIAPVIGGVALPGAMATVNPFFANIRQNMDLADGVGRIDVNLPSSVVVDTLPKWLKEAADPADHGSKVSNKFLSIELAEKARMEHAFGVVRPTNPDVSANNSVQLCGVEQGVKNRYKDILPFEHARVRLQNRAPGDCDYVNASHLRANHTNKRYIASQAPLPATYNDFWGMVWDEDVRVIVMLTAESEGGQIKCHPYWQGTEFGQLTLRLISEKKVSLDIDGGDKLDKLDKLDKSRSSSNIPASAVEAPTCGPDFGRRRAQTLVSGDGDTSGSVSAGGYASGSGPASDTPFVVVRKFALGHRGRAFAPLREVTQLHYASWPDFGTPAQPSHLLALVELANMMQRASSPVNVPRMFERTAQLAGSSGRGGSGSNTPSNTTPINSNSDKIEHIRWPAYDEPAPASGAGVRPMLVHCSAGCGRTGTFCTVDSVVDMLKQQKQRAAHAKAPAQAPTSASTSASAQAGEDTVMADGDYLGNQPAQTQTESAWLDCDSDDLVAGAVEDFRTQRLSMVQTLKQYVLCYETVAEWVSKSHERRGGHGRAKSESIRMFY